jgi:serine/threonine-protein phosphatase PP1 catalytic subunit
MYPDQIFLLRGNHETFQLNRHYGFREHCDEMFGKNNGLLFWKECNTLFSHLSRSALINKMVYCMHGGLSPKMFEPSFINLEQLKQYKSDDGNDRSLTGKRTILTDLYWSDPLESDPKSKVKKNGWGPNSRGDNLYTFDETVVQEFHKKFKTKMIVRAHQVVDDGYEPFAEEESMIPGLFTIFSAPSYTDMKNKAAVMSLNFDKSESVTLKKSDRKFNIVHVKL